MDIAEVFGRVVVRPGQRQVLLDGELAPLGARAFDVLLALMERRDRVVTKNELLELVWPGRVVEENNLVMQVGTLRRLLGTDLVATIPGRGYRFSAPPWPQSAGQAVDHAPSMAAEHGLRTNLPAVLMPLIGRDEDAKALGTVLQEHRLVTITGAGGIGKSRLAQQLLHERRQCYPQGVTWVDLAALSDPVLVAGTIARAVGVQMGGGEPLKALVLVLKSVNMLVALDNAEHVLEEVARVTQALQERAPGVRLLVTSQVPLKLLEEQVVRLEPLAVPDAVLPPAKALSFSAVQLFVQRAQASDRHFTLDEHNVTAVIEVCRRLDGLPLAIELAAARVPLLGVHALAAALDGQLRLLSSGQRLAPARQQTLRAALEWSHGLLNDAEQTVLRRLAVFVGGFSLELAQQVVSDTDAGLDEWAVLDVLGSLIDRSLVVAEMAEPPRYRLLESTRTFALERLASAQEDGAIRARHARAVCARFNQVFVDRLAGRMPSDAAHHALALDMDNALQAANWSVLHDPPCAVALMSPLNSARSISFEQQRPLWVATEAFVTDALPAPLRAQWATGACRFWLTLKLDRADHWAQEAVRLQRQLSDPVGLYLALYSAATVHTLRQDRTRAMEVLLEMHALENPNWPPVLLHRRAQIQGEIESMFGLSDGGQRAFDRALSLAMEAGDSHQRYHSLMCIADTALSLGRIDDAVRYGGELVEVQSRTRDRHTFTQASINLTAAWLAKDAVVEARKTAKNCWLLATQFSMQQYWADHVALLAALEGRPHCAALLLGYADKGYIAHGAARQPSEASAVERVEDLVREHLGDAKLASLRVEGKSLPDEAIAALAFPVQAEGST